MTSTREKWDATYSRDVGEPPPAQLLRDYETVLQGRVLDLACGAGQNGLHLARRGHDVDLIDLAHTPLARAVRVGRDERLRLLAVQADLEEFPLPRSRYGVVLNFRYLQRNLWRPIKEAVRPGGIVVFETFTIEQAALGHPRNPAFLLRPGELRSEFDTWDILHSYEGLSRDATAHIAQLVAQRRIG